MRGPRVELDVNGRPVYISVPSPDELRTTTPTGDNVKAVYDYMSAYGIDGDVAMKEHLATYIRRFSGGDLSSLVESAYSDRVAVATVRRHAQQAETVASMGGRTDQVCVYINDGDNPCSECADLNGEEQWYSWFVENNAMPGDRCLGGDNCRCILQPVSLT